MGTIILLIIFILQSTKSSNILRNNCNKNAIFFSVLTDYKVSNHPVNQKTVPTINECFRSCLDFRQCHSIAIKFQSDGTMLCSMYNHGYESNILNFEYEKGWKFYNTGPQSKRIGHTCRSLSYDPCLGNICHDACGGKGYKCITGNSCKQLKDKFSSLDLPSGQYQIQLSFGTIAVHCNMNIMGGGWLLVASVVLKNPKSPQTILEEKLSRIGNLSRNFVLNPVALKQLWDETSFTQMQFYCKKVKVARVFHAISNPNTTSVVDWYIKDSTPAPDACGSFLQLGDDNSTLLNNCGQWGQNGGKIGPSRSLYEGSMWIVSKAHWNTLMKGAEYRYECDDFDRTGEKLSIGDMWQIYVR